MLTAKGLPVVFVQGVRRERRETSEPWKKNKETQASLVRGTGQQAVRARVIAHSNPRFRSQFVSNSRRHSPLHA